MVCGGGEWYVVYVDGEFCLLGCLCGIGVCGCVVCDVIVLFCVDCVVVVCEFGFDCFYVY